MAIVSEDVLSQFIKSLGEDLCCLELLLFFGKHPNARFNRKAVIQSATMRGIDTERALNQLVNKKLIVTSFQNEVILFSLTRNEPDYSMVKDLVDIGQQQWQMILKPILEAQEII